MSEIDDAPQIICVTSLAGAVYSIRLSAADGTGSAWFEQVWQDDAARILGEKVSADDAERALKAKLVEAMKEVHRASDDAEGAWWSRVIEVAIAKAEGSDE